MSTEQEKLRVNPAIGEMLRAFHASGGREVTVEHNREVLASLKDSNSAPRAQLLKAHPNLEAKLSSLTKLQKFAVILMSLPPEWSADLLPQLRAETVRQITSEIRNLPSIAPDLRDAVHFDLMFGLVGKVYENSGDYSRALEELWATEPAVLAYYLELNYVNKPDGEEG